MRILLLSFLLAGCATQSLPTSPITNPNIVYKYDMRGSINGRSFDGVGVIPKAEKYVMRVQSRTDIDLLTITSCHRDFSVESAVKMDWFQTSRGYEYTFIPSKGIEDTGSCLVRLGALNKGQGQNSWGIIDFETPEETLPAKNFCNGRTEQTQGVSICQSRAGLYQRIEFEVPVRISAAVQEKCKMKSADGKSWEYLLPAGECVIAFQEIGGGRYHRHTTIAYTDILIRGGE